MTKLNLYYDLALSIMDKKLELSQEERDIFFRNMTLMELRKGDYLFQIGDEIKYSYIIVDGLLRSFNVYNDREVTRMFYQSYEAVADYPAISNFESATYNIQAIKPSKVLAFPIENQRKLLKTSIKYQHLFIKRVNNLLKIKLERELHFMAYNGEERLNAFKENNPELFNLIPDLYIASYIGITPVQLSRLNNKKNKKEIL